MTKKQKVKLYNLKNMQWWDKKLLKKIFRIGLPIIIISIILSLTDVTDNISLGIWAPKNAIGIAGYAGRLYWIVYLLVSMPAAMFGFLVAQYYGAKDYEKEKRVVATITLFSFLISVISLVVIHLAGKDILGLFIKKDANYNFYRDNAYEYVKVFSYLMLLEAIVEGIEIGVESEGKTKFMAIVLILVIPFNFLFNYIFMKELNWGTIGCAYSTLLSWLILSTLIVLWVTIQTRRGKIHFGFNPLTILKLDRKILKSGLKRIGSGFSNITHQVSIIIIMTIFSRNYENGIIVTSIVGPFFSLIMFTSDGVVSTKTNLVGTELGAGRFQKAYEIDTKINFYTFVFAIINSLLIFALAYPIPLLYAKETSENKMLATYFLVIAAFFYPIMAIDDAFVDSLIIGGKGNQAFLVDSVQPFVLEVGALFLIITIAHPPFLLLYFLYRFFRSLRAITSYLLWRRKTWITNETNVKEVKT